MVQVTLLAVESAQSGPALRLLTRHAQGLASALLSHLLAPEQAELQGPQYTCRCPFLTEEATCLLQCRTLIRL